MRAFLAEGQQGPFPAVAGFSGCGRRWLSCCRTQTLGTGPQSLWLAGLGAPQHVGNPPRPRLESVSCTTNGLSPTVSLGSLGHPLTWDLKLTELTFYPRQRNFIPLLTGPLPSSLGPNSREKPLGSSEPSQGQGPLSYTPRPRPRPPSLADLEKITFLSPSHSFLICKTV